MLTSCLRLTLAQRALLHSCKVHQLTACAPLLALSDVQAARLLHHLSAFDHRQEAPLPCHQQPHSSSICRHITSSSASWHPRGPPSGGPPEPPFDGKMRFPADGVSEDDDDPFPDEAEALEEDEGAEHEHDEGEFEDVLATLQGEKVEGDNEGYDPLQDEEDEDEDPDVLEIKQASKKKQKFLLQQYWRNLQEHRDQDQDDLAVIKANDEMGWQRFAMKLVDVNRITKVTRQGRLIRYSCFVAVGNGMGAVGIGKAKSLQLNLAIRKAHVRALRYPMVIQRYRRATVYAPVEWKYGKTRVRVWPKSLGNGIKANQLLGDIARLIGFTDLGVKVIGSTNNRNQVKAFLYGLLSIRDPVDIAKEQGKVVLERAVGKYHIPLDRLLVHLGHRHPNWPNVTPEEQKAYEPSPFRAPVRPDWYE